MLKKMLTVDKLRWRVYWCLLYYSVRVSVCMKFFTIKLGGKKKVKHGKT